MKRNKTVRYILMLLAIAAMLVLLCSCQTGESIIENGQKYLESEDCDKAEECFKKALEHEEVQKEAYIGLYNVYSVRGENESAENYLREGYQKTQDEEIKSLLEQVIIEKFEQSGLNTDVPFKSESKDETSNRIEELNAAHDINNDVVGWLYVPELPDVDRGVCHDANSYSYGRRDITGKKLGGLGSGEKYWVYGAYYTHMRNTFGDNAAALSTNTVIFGSSDNGITNKNCKDDDPEGPLFSQLFSFKDPDFAQKTPYIYFYTPKERLVYEIFSVFYNDAEIDEGKSLWYIEPEPKKEYQKLLDTVRERSLYNYDVEVGTDDKILTLSTNTVGWGLQKRGNYRFAIVAKLVDKDEKAFANIAINADAPIPTTYKDEFDKYAKDWKPIFGGKLDFEPAKTEYKVHDLEYVEERLKYDESGNIVIRTVYSKDGTAENTTYTYRDADGNESTVTVFKDGSIKNS